jgi:hypothetical protein
MATSRPRALPGIGEPDGMPADYRPRWNAGEHLDLRDRAGIATAVLSPVPTDETTLVRSRPRENSPECRGLGPNTDSDGLKRSEYQLSA